MADRIQSDSLFCLDHRGAAIHRHVVHCSCHHCHPRSPQWDLGGRTEGGYWLRGQERGRKISPDPFFFLFRCTNQNSASAPCGLLRAKMCHRWRCALKKKWHPHTSGKAQHISLQIGNIFEFAHVPQPHKCGPSLRGEGSL